MANEIDYTPALNLVVLSDQPENVRWLKTSFEHAGLKVIKVDTPDEFGQLACDSFTLVVFDTEPTQLEAALIELRANPSMRNAVVLVRAERIPDTAIIAGVCPQYRALVCYHDDLARLIRQHAKLEIVQTSEGHNHFMC